MGKESEIRLRPLRAQDDSQALAAQAELAPEGFDFLGGSWQPGIAWADYLAALDRERVGDVEPGRVPAVSLGAFIGATLIGRTSIRLALNDYLFDRGGHIGYGVRPAFRRQGYATEILRQSLIIVRAHGVNRVMVTCDDDNLPSAGTIERCGGVLEDIREDPGESMRWRRYWID